MLIDRRNTFAREEALPGSTGTTVFGRSIPLDVAADQGEGYPLYLWIAVGNNDPASGGDATIKFELVTDTVAELNDDPKVLLETPEVAVADMQAGTVLISVAIPKADYGYYMGLRAVVGTAGFTGGYVNAVLVQDPPNWRAYPEGLN